MVLTSEALGRLLFIEYATNIIVIINYNIQDNVYGAVIMAEPLQEFTRFI